jgi:predicted acylesterase/phospholipase RssA
MGQTKQNHPKTEAAPHRPERDAGQIVLVLQGGGALGAYQVGVYEALHEAGIEPAWVIGTSIGAINAAIISGNPPEQRLAKPTPSTVRFSQPLAGGDEGTGTAGSSAMLGFPASPGTFRAP